jgi:hypothetical protein
LANQRAIACGDKLQDWTAQQGLGVCAYHCVRCARRRDNDAFVTHLDQQIGGSEREGDVAIAFQPCRTVCSGISLVMGRGSCDLSSAPLSRQT